MQIFFTHTDPHEAAKMLPSNKQARLLSEVCQMLSKAYKLKPFMRPKHPAQGNDLCSFIQDNLGYRLWVWQYAESLYELRSDREGASIVLSAAKDLFNTIEPDVFDTDVWVHSAPVRLPKEFVKQTEYEPRSIQPVDIAVKIYKELLNFKYFRSEL